MQHKPQAREATQPTVTIKISWMEIPKRWRIDVRYWTGSHWANYWTLAETSSEIDQVVAKHLMDDVRQRLEFLLF